MQTKNEKAKIIKLQHAKSKVQQSFALYQTPLGQGHSAKVYKGVSLDDPTRVYAVKVIRIQSSQQKQKCLKQLAISKALPDCPNLAQIHQQHLQSQNNIYIFEEFCQGGSLEQYRYKRQQPFNEEEMFDIFFQVYTGVKQLCKAGIMHEDIKPSNILLKHPVRKQYGKYLRNVYKICDFGVSQLVADVKLSKTRKGTISYMPLEKLRKDFLPNPKSEIYSLGVTLYEIFFGRHPYLDKRVSDYKVYIEKIKQAKLKPITQILNKQQRDNLSIRFEKMYEILEKMINLNENKRISFEELQAYMQTSQPFKNMSVQEIITLDQQLPKIINPNIKYDAIGVSVINMMNQPEDIRQSKAFFLNSSKIKNNLMKKYYDFLKRAICYISKGLQCLKDFNTFFLTEPYHKKNTSQNFLEIKLEGLKRINLLQFLIAFTNSSIIKNFLQKYNDYFLNHSQEDTYYVQQDAEYLSNQFLKIFTEIQQPNKKQFFAQLKEISAELPTIIINEFNYVFQKTNVVRINFNNEMLSLFFLKFAPTILQMIKRLNKQTIKNQSIFNTQQIAQCNEIMTQFQALRTAKKQGLYKAFEAKIKPFHDILEDCEQNSDEFQLLEYDMLQQL